MAQKLLFSTSIPIREHLSLSTFIFKLSQVYINCLPTFSCCSYLKSVARYEHLLKLALEIFRSHFSFN